MTTKIDRICRKNAISSSADPRTPRLLTFSNTCVQYMYTYVIYTAHIYMCVYNAVFGGYHPVYQRFIIVGDIVGKSPTGILTLLNLS